MKNKHILISGAGPAGLSLAYCLKQYGFIPTLVEKHSALRAEGYKLDIRGAAMEVVRRLGLEEEVLAARTQIREALFVDDSGKYIAQTTPDLCGVRSDGDCEVVRGSLCRILYEHLSDVECLFGDEITALEECEEGVYVTFEKAQTRLFDLVIGADGLHSKVRRLIWGEEVQFLRELGLYVSFYSIPNFLQLDCVEIEYHSPKRFAIAYCPRDGLAKAGFAFSAKRPDLDLRDPECQKQFVQEAFAQSGWKIPQFLAYMHDAPDFYFDCMAQVHMPHYSKGRIALAGDAGYAVSPIAGQGLSVALVGAYVLAGELAAAQGNYVHAFARYEECLSRFVKKNQDLVKMSAILMEGEGVSSWVSSAAAWLSRHIYRFAPGSVIVFCKNLGMRHTREAANAVELKNYP
ncbi:MAG TPA: FAD-dependent monooxygenase [Rhabdochlamydiaceae bacterium]